jgi:PadR family transcriptional regulator, regulatory protein AphA
MGVDGSTVIGAPVWLSFARITAKRLVDSIVSRTDGLSWTDGLDCTILAIEMQDIQLTPTSYIVLGLLAQAGQATPYELKQIVDASVGHFWSLPRSQLYAEPTRLTHAGYLTEDQEPNGRRRKRYTLTKRGYEALQHWKATPTDHHTELRDLAFLKLLFGADPSAMADAQLTTLRPLLEAYETTHATYTKADPSGPRHTVEAGIDHIKTSILIWERIARETHPSTASTPDRSRGR